MNAARHPAVQAVKDRFPGAEVVDVIGYITFHGAKMPRDAVAPAPIKNFNLTQLADTARTEADRIRTVQAGLVADGEREQPATDLIERADHFDALARLADKVAGDGQLKQRLRQIAAAAARRAQPVVPQEDIEATEPTEDAEGGDDA